MVEYFRFPTQSIGGFQLTSKEDTAKEINRYAKDKNLRVVQIAVCEDNGMFVVFETLN